MSPLSSEVFRTARRTAYGTIFRNMVKGEIGQFGQSSVPVKDAEVVIFSIHEKGRGFDPQFYVQELAMARALANRNIRFAVTDKAETIFNKKVFWTVRLDLMNPILWNYSSQLNDFAKGLESQGNQLFCSSEELLFWENKGHMHRKFDEAEVPTPKTIVLTNSNVSVPELPGAPLLVKEEHSSGSQGIHFFDSADKALKFIQNHDWKPDEKLIVQSIIQGATKDLRVTIVGDKIIPSATYWRIKSKSRPDGPVWTTTATTYNSTVLHDQIPPGTQEFVSGVLRKLGMRTAGADLMWENDDISKTPLVLEVSPIYQPNPPKPARYENYGYKQFKKKKFGKETYFVKQFDVFLDIANAILDQDLL
jgi:glutathione synthase/RimK-type ligase-like ATP-grasp enzyme